jgi:hypothetical protein
MMRMKIRLPLKSISKNDNLKISLYWLIAIIRSAYTYFITQNHENAKEALLKDEKEASTGAVMSYLGQRVRRSFAFSSSYYHSLVFSGKPCHQKIKLHMRS